MRIVVDTNVIFSALVNTNSAIMDIIVGSKEFEKVLNTTELKLMHYNSDK
jgi:predicted nucleic acid-binding protein